MLKYKNSFNIMHFFIKTNIFTYTLSNSY